MKYSLEVSCASSEKWLAVVLENFDCFLQDHADCERKASSMAMSFVATLYPAYQASLTQPAEVLRHE